MRFFFLVTSLLLAISPLYANPFLGKWRVTKVETPNTYFGEIKYPKHFELTQQNGQLSGQYHDQYGYECDFSLIELINAGNELLLIGCGVTKHANSWMPVHKVKLINDRLVGKVITHSTQFTWYAEAVKPNSQ